MAEERRRAVYPGDRRPAVRGNLAVQPERKPEVVPQQQDLRKEAARRIEEKVRVSRLSTRLFTKAQVAVIALALALILVAGIFYLQQVLELRTKKNEAASLEKKYQQLVRDNALLENSYESHIDYDGIYEYVTGLGMRLPEKQQVITYERPNPEYVAKDGEIPDE